MKRLLAAACLCLTACAGNPPAKEGQASSMDSLTREMRAAAESHFKGEYQASSKSIEAAYHMAGLRDTLSLSRELGSSLLMEDLETYKGYSHELIMLNTLGMLNYSLLGEDDEAVVEARRFDTMVKYLKERGRLEGDTGIFARYLSGAVYEAAGKKDDARIDYQLAFDQLGAGKEPGKAPLLLEQSLSRLKEGAPQDPKKGTLLCIIYDGQIPALGRATDHDLNAMMVAGSPAPQDLTLSEQGLPLARAELMEDLGLSLSAELEKRNGGLFRGMKIFLRESLHLSLVVSLAILFQSEDMMKLYSPAPPDMRQWDNLPERIWVARVELPPGPHQVDLSLTGFQGELRQLSGLPVTLKPGKFSFAAFRIDD